MSTWLALTAASGAVVFATLGLRVRAPVVPPPPDVPGGDVHRGRVAIQRYGCGACHIIPGVAGANSPAGPPLIQFGGRSVVGGRLPNTPANLIAWLQNPQAIAPGSAMPNLGVTEADARDIAAYLLSLR